MHEKPENFKKHGINAIQIIPCILWSFFAVVENFQTLFQSSPGPEHILKTYNQNLSKGIDHGGDHPYLNQLDVGSAWEWLANSKETEIFIFSTQVLLRDKEHLQSG